MTLPLFGELTHHPGGKYTYINIVGARNHRLADPNIPSEAVVDLVGHGEAEGDGSSNEEKAQPRDELLGL